MRLCYGLFIVVCSACGGGNGYGTNPPPPPPPPGGGPTVNASMTDNNGLVPFAFSPATLTVTVGTSVTWTNNGKTGHTTTSDATPTPVWSSGAVNPAGSTTCDPADPYCQPAGTPAGTYTRVFNAAGTYPYHCEFHKLQGMTGTITVNP